MTELTHTHKCTTCIHSGAHKKLGAIWLYGAFQNELNAPQTVQVNLTIFENLIDFVSIKLFEINKLHASPQ